MIKAGNDIASLLIDASIQKQMGGLGGGRAYSISNFPTKFQDIIQAFIDDKIDSVTAIYLAMEMFKPSQKSFFGTIGSKEPE